MLRPELRTKNRSSEHLNAKIYSSIAHARQSCKYLKWPWSTWSTNCFQHCISRHTWLHEWVMGD